MSQRKGSARPKVRDAANEAIEISTHSDDVAAAADVDASTMSSREPDFRWAGKPVYRCRICGPRYERVDNLPAVLEHERLSHAPFVRQSSILGADGSPLQVVEEEK